MCVWLTGVTCVSVAVWLTGVTSVCVVDRCDLCVLSSRLELVLHVQDGATLAVTSLDDLRDFNQPHMPGIHYPA